MLLLALVVLLFVVQPGTSVDPDMGEHDHPVRDPPRDPRRLSDAHDADRRHRPVGRHSSPRCRRSSWRPRLRARAPCSRSCWRLAVAASGRSRQRCRHVHLPGPALDHDPRHEARGRRLLSSTSVRSSPQGSRSRPRWPGSEGATFGWFPNALLVFVPLAASSCGLRYARVSVDCCMRSATTRSPPGSPGYACRTCCWSSMSSRAARRSRRARALRRHQHGVGHPRRTRPCCHPWPPRSSAAHRSSAVEEDTQAHRRCRHPDRPDEPPDGAQDPRADAAGRLRHHHPGRRGRLSPRHRRVR